MASTRTTPVSSRKSPKQARSNELVTAVLDAAIQVLKAEGARRFTTARVAERAGVSVGSLYQYFPNKASILFRLQSDEWRQTTGILSAILQDRTRPPLERLRDLVHTFVRSECEEAEVRMALNDAAPLYRDAPEADEVRAESNAIYRAFMREALPTVEDDRRELATDLLKSTLSEVGSRFSEKQRTDAEIERYADGISEMFCAYLERLQLAASGVDNCTETSRRHSA